MGSGAELALVVMRAPGCVASGSVGSSSADETGAPLVACAARTLCDSADGAQLSPDGFFMSCRTNCQTIAVRRRLRNVRVFLIARSAGYRSTQTPLAAVC
jgi:hypothetical protein